MKRILKISLFFIVLLLLSACLDTDPIQKANPEEVLTADRTLNKKEKALVKESEILNYIARVYGNVVQITGFEVIPEEPEEEPFVIVKVKDKEEGWKANISCEMNDDEKGEIDCRPYDDYLFVVLSKGAKAELKPFVEKSFASDERKLGLLIFSALDNANEKRWFFSQKPDYQHLKEETPIEIYLRMKGSAASINKYYDAMYSFIQQVKIMDVDKSRISGITLILEGNPKDFYDHPSIQQIYVPFNILAAIHAPKDLKKYTEPGFLEYYDTMKERFKEKEKRIKKTAIIGDF